MIRWLLLSALLADAVDGVDEDRLGGRQERT